MGINRSLAGQNRSLKKEQDENVPDPVPVTHHLRLNSQSIPAMAIYVREQPQTHSSTFMSMGYSPPLLHQQSTGTAVPVPSLELNNDTVDAIVVTPPHKKHYLELPVLTGERPGGDTDGDISHLEETNSARESCGDQSARIDTKHEDPVSSGEHKGYTKSYDQEFMSLPATPTPRSKNVGDDKKQQSKKNDPGLHALYGSEWERSRSRQTHPSPIGSARAQKTGDIPVLTGDRPAHPGMPMAFSMGIIDYG